MSGCELTSARSATAASAVPVRQWMGRRRLVAEKEGQSGVTVQDVDAITSKCECHDAPAARTSRLAPSRSDVRAGRSTALGAVPWRRAGHRGLQECFKLFDMIHACTSEPDSITQIAEEVTAPGGRGMACLTASGGKGKPWRFLAAGPPMRTARPCTRMTQGADGRPRLVRRACANRVGCAPPLSPQHHNPPPPPLRSPPPPPPPALAPRCGAPRWCWTLRVTGAPTWSCAPRPRRATA